MNKTQKYAWSYVALSLSGVALAIKGLPGALAGKSMPVVPWIFPWFWLILVIALIARRKRPAEVDSDERDELIKARAAEVAAAWGLLLLSAANILSVQMVGPDGSIPVQALLGMNTVVICIAAFVYSVAILVQYGREGKDGKK